ncbi:MAG TPA: hypothetical protein VIU12_31440 [Chryseolinea sp.]
MNGEKEAEAINKSRDILGLDKSVPSVAYKVINLHNPGGDYYIVIFGERNASVAIAAVDGQDLTIKTSATLKGTNAHLPVDRNQAIDLAGGKEVYSLDLVWKPGKLSRSPLYPIWRVHTSNGIKYVGQTGELSQDLDDGPRG